MLIVINNYYWSKKNCELDKICSWYLLGHHRNPLQGWLLYSGPVSLRCFPLSTTGIFSDPKMPWRESGKLINYECEKIRNYSVSNFFREDVYVFLATELILGVGTIEEIFLASLYKVGGDQVCYEVEKAHL